MKTPDSTFALENNYYSVAINDLLFLQHNLGSGFYNNIATQAQQVAEKLLKSVAESCVVQNHKIFSSHNLRNINSEIFNNGINLKLDKKELSLLKDFYYESRYPGDGFVVVTKEDCEDGLLILSNVLDSVNGFRKENGLSTHYPNAFADYIHRLKLERQTVKVHEEKGIG